MRYYLIADEDPARDAEWERVPSGARTDLGRIPTCEVSEVDLAIANDPETMEEIRLLAVGEETVIGQCDPIRRIR